MIDLAAIIKTVQRLDESILVQQAGVVIIYGLLAKIADLFIDRVIRRLASRMRYAVDDYIEVLHGPLCWTIFLMGIQHALVLRPMHPPWQTVLPALARSAMLLVWLVALLRLYNQVAERNLAGVLLRGKIGKDLFLLLKNIIRVVIAAAGLLWLFAIWQIDLTPLFASAGIAGIAVALAAKETLSNFFGGVSIFVDNTFKVGDFIVLDTGERGEVAEIGIRSTRINTSDDTLLTIPNSILANSRIINESAPLPRSRIRVPVGVAYGSDLDQVERVLLQVARDNANIAADPQPLVRVRGFGDSAINFELLCWVADPSRRGLEVHNLLKAIYRVFAAESIIIPFPQREVHISEGILKVMATTEM